MDNEPPGHPDDMWPEYFQPRADQESILAEKEGARIATSLLDIFYLRASDSEPASLVAVVGCMGGEIDVVCSDSFDRMPDDVKEQIQLLQINQRNRFRLIVAQKIDIFRLDALKTDISGKGFNDAVRLFGSMQARIFCHNGKTSIVLIESEGRIAIGKIDLLQSIRMGISNPLVQLIADVKKTYHMFIATGKNSEVLRGKSLALVYPLRDPDIGEIADNEEIMRNVTYNLLNSLQSDMIQSGIRIPFTENLFPVPNRAQFIEKIKEEGYEIRGNAAFKTDVNRKPRSTTLLGQLRQSAESWFAPVVGLPYEASLDDYAALIDEGLSHVVTSEDKEAMDAVTTRTFDAFTPTVKQTVRLPESQATFSVEATLLQPEQTKPDLRLRTTALLPPAAVEPENWAKDFTVLPSQPLPVPIPHHHWWDDFAIEEDAKSTVTITMHDMSTTTRQAEKEKFRDGLSSSQNPGIPEVGHEVSSSGQSAYADDFGEILSGRDEKVPGTDPGWENDFR